MPLQNGRDFVADTLKCIFCNNKIWVEKKNSFTLVTSDRIPEKSALITALNKAMDGKCRFGYKIFEHYARPVKLTMDLPSNRLVVS